MKFSLIVLSFFITEIALADMPVRSECITRPGEMNCETVRFRAPTTEEFRDGINQVKSNLDAFKTDLKTIDDNHNIKSMTLDKKIIQNQSETYKELQNVYKTLLIDENFKKFVQSIVNEELQKRTLRK